MGVSRLRAQSMKGIWLSNSALQMCRPYVIDREKLLVDQRVRKGIFAVDYHPGHGSTRTLLHRVRSSRALKISEFESVALIQTVISMEFLLYIIG